MRWWERARFVHEHPAYTYAAFDEMSAGDFALDKDFHAMLEGLQSAN